MKRRMPAPWRRLRLALACLAMACAASASAERHLLQVEHFNGPWRRQTNIRGFLGDGFCTSNANPEVAETAMTTTLQIQTAARYRVFVRAFTSANSRRALQAAVNGNRLAVTHNGRRRRWAWELAGEVDLPAGEATVAVHDADVGWETADAILLTTDKNEDPMADERRWQLYPDGLPERANALRFNIEACLAQCRRHQAPASKEAWETRRSDVAAALRQALRPWPEKAALNARITGRAQRDGYVIENLVFESLPGLAVPANVYIPTHVPKPMPAVIVTAGHAMADGKNYDLYRTGQIGLVRLGFLVLAYDPVGQGERRRRGFSHTLAWNAFMVGHTLLGYMTWDTVRALDYLLTRPEVDPERIGLTGNSGGGMNTFYAFPVEPRLAAAASSCFVCSYHAFLKDGGNHCICNHLPSVTRRAEEFEFVSLAAPRPFLATNGAKDPIFPIRGTRRTIERAKRVYGYHDAAERVALFEAPLPHGWAKPMREAAYGWFRRWLQGKGDGSPFAEPEIELEPKSSKALRCFKDGQMPEGAKTLAAVLREEAERLIAAYPPVPDDASACQAWAKRLRERLWDVLGGRPTGFEPQVTSHGTFPWRGHTVERLTVQTEPSLQVPALLLRPSDARTPMPAVIYLDDEGKAAARNSKPVRELLKRGIGVLALDVRALGEGKVHANHCASDAVVLGRPLLG
ncbi:MAG: alpha/beta hydrolase family protein, partial [Planctomycetota bacterium]